MNRTIRISLFALLLGFALFAAAVANNNIAFRKMSRNEFQQRLDRSIRESIEWEASLPVENNPYLTYMLRDCTEMAGEQKIAALLVRSAPVAANTFLARLADPSAPFVIPPIELDKLDAYERWIVYAISRGEYGILRAEKNAMFEFRNPRTGRATHQLYSLILYRRYNGSTPAVDGLVRQLSLRIAQEAAIDFRVTDLYLQRIAFLLAAGQWDLVKPRWVERALAAQDGRGGWSNSWYGWRPTPYKFSFEDEADSHATSQGLWLGYMLKYRYPEWIERNYQ